MSKNGNGEGSVYKDKQGRWRGQVNLPSTDGKVKRKYFYGKTRKEVSDKVNELLMQLQTNTYIEPSQITLYNWLCTWLDTYNQDIRATTRVNYETYVHRHIRSTIGRYKLSDVTTIIIQQFYNDKVKSGKLDGSGEGLNPKTLRNMHNMLHKALNQAVYLNMIAKNPVDYAVLPKRNKTEMRYFTKDEQKRLQEVIRGNRLEMPVLLDLYTGMRQGELLGLMWKNVHIDLNGQSYIRVVQTLMRIQNPDTNSDKKTVLTICEPKTKNSIRTIPLIPEIAERLSIYRIKQAEYFKGNELPKSDFVFTSTTGTPIEPRDFQRDFKKILIKYGLSVVNVHGLRHTFATRSLESGMSVKTLSKILGHANTAFTMDTYCHASDILQAEEISQLSEFLL